LLKGDRPNHILPFFQQVGILRAAENTQQVVQAPGTTCCRGEEHHFRNQHIPVLSLFTLVTGIDRNVLGFHAGQRDVVQVQEDRHQQCDRRQQPQDQANCHRKLTKQNQVSILEPVGFYHFSDQTTICRYRMIIRQSQGPIDHLSIDKSSEWFMEEALQPPQTDADTQDG